MKKYIASICFILIVSFSNSQTYRTLFDNLNQTYFGGTSDSPFLFTNVYYHILQNDASTIMRSYIVMYKATNDKKYLNQFVIYAKRVQELRDDNILNLENSGVLKGLPLSTAACTTTSLTNIPSFPADSKGWTANFSDTNCDRYPHYMESGNICFPMAEFILLIKESPGLENEILPFEVNSQSFTSAVYGSQTITTYLQFSNWLESRIHETISWHSDNQLDGNDLFYDNNNYTGPINMQSSIGRLTAIMYHISVLNGSPIVAYETITKRIGNYVYEKLYDPAIGTTPTISDPDGCYVWCHLDGCIEPVEGTALWEDISHAWLDIEFIELCYQYNIQTSGLYNFSELDMKKLSNTFLYRMNQFPLKIHMNVYGTDSDCNQMCTGDPANNFFQIFGYTFLAKYKPAIYNLISDFYVPSNFLDPYNSDAIPLAVPQQMKAYADLLFYQNLFNPIAVKRNTGNQYISGATEGKFSGSENEIALINNDNTSTSKISTYTIDATTNVISNTSDYSFSSGGSLYMASGDIIPSLPGDEIITLDRTNNKLIVLNKSGTTISNVSQISFSNPQALEIASIGIGEFDATHNGKEIILNLTIGLGSPALFMYGFNPITNLFENIPLTANGISMSPPFKFTVGDFNGDGIDDIAFCSSSITEVVLKIYTITSSLQLANIAVSAETNLAALLIPAMGYTNWNGITSGDFDGDGIDEIMLHRTLDGKFLIYRQVLNDIVYKGDESFPINQQNGIMCSARLTNFPQSEALVSLRSYDGQISIFNMEGLCPGLNLSNQTIDQSTSVDYPTPGIENNYPIDYHVNNTLTVGNGFNIISPSIVDMSSGKEIAFKPGFSVTAGSDLQAYINPALECNPSTFRRNTPQQPSNQTQQVAEVKKIKQIVIGNIGIAPNPNNGSFQITITRNDKPIAIKEIKVYDIMGKVIWENGSSGNNIFTIDITSYAQGVYYVKCINVFGEMEIKKLIKQ